MKYPYFIFLLLLCCSKNEQNKPLTKNKNIHTFYNEFIKNKDLNTEQVFQNIKKLEESAKGNENDEAMLNTAKGIYFARRSSFELSEHYLRKVSENPSVQDSIKDFALIGLGNIYKHKGEYPKALSYYQKALKIANNRQDTIRMAGAYSSIAQMNSEKGDAKESKKNIERVFELLKNKKHENAYLIAAHTLANNEGMSGNYAEALKIDEQNLKICDSIKNEESKVSFQDNKARCYMMMGKLDSAKIYFEKNLIIDKKFKRINWIADSYINLAEVSMMKNDFAAAENYMKQSLEILSKSNYAKNQLKAYEVLSKIYEKKGDFQRAYETKNAYSELYAKMMNEKTQASFTEFNVIYETEKKNKEILQHKNTLFKRNAEIFSLLGLFLVGGGITFSLFRHRRKNEKIKLQKEVLRQQDLAMKAVMEAEDNERKRMATHLHDGVGQLLSAVNMNVSVLDDFKEDKNNFYKILEKTQRILDDAMADVRSLSHQIMPNMLIKNSLGNALRDLIEKTNSPKLNISLKIEGLKENLDQNIQVVLYRIIQECINNTIKHAEANTIDILLNQEKDKIFAEISDNGKGFNPLKINSKSSGLGLENIKSRIEFLKGNINIESAEGKGTKVKVEIPL